MEKMDDIDPELLVNSARQHQMHLNHADNNVPYEAERGPVMLVHRRKRGHTATTTFGRLLNNCLDMRMLSAIKLNDSEKITMLISKGVDVNKKDDYGRSFLHVAASLGYRDSVRVLLAAGADPNAEDIGRNNPLHIAVVAMSFDCVQLLLEAGSQGIPLIKTISLLDYAQSQLRRYIDSTRPSTRIEALEGIVSLLEQAIEAEALAENVSHMDLNG